MTRPAVVPFMAGPASLIPGRGALALEALPVMRPQIQAEEGGSIPQSTL
jgi:hypothetical protein